MRNQGIGSWEINLAAFLADLNTNRWHHFRLGAAPYYRETNEPGFSNIGAAFDDALRLLSLSLRLQLPHFGARQSAVSRMLTADHRKCSLFDNIDEYSDGPLMTTPFAINDLAAKHDHFALVRREQHQPFL